MKIKKEINKWQFYFCFGTNPCMIENGWKQVSFGIFKIHTLPEQGEMLYNKHYKGFLIKFNIWFPIYF